MKTILAPSLYSTPAADLPIHIAVIGFGAWGPKLARNLASSKAYSLAAICDSSAERLHAASRAYPEVQVSSDWREITDNRKIQAVAVATPADTHFEIGDAAVKAGKHIFLEKPLAPTVAQASELIEESVRRNLTLMVDHTFVFSPAVRYIRQLLRAGELGPLCTVDSYRFNAGTVRTDTPVHWDLACHDLSILHYLVDGLPCALAATSVTPQPGHPPHSVQLKLFYRNPFLANMKVSWVAPPKTRRTIFNGRNGAIVYDDMDTCRKVQVRGTTLERCRDAQLDTTEPLKLAVDHFADCIQTGRQPISGGPMGLDVVRMLEAADRSLIEGGRPISICSSGRKA